MPRGSKAVQVSRSEARLYVGKAQQFATEARVALEEGRYDAALLSAVQAAISAGDAITTALAGRRSTDPDHERAVDLLEEVLGSDEPDRPIRQVRLLLAKKNVVEYESRRATAKEADEGVTRAQRVVAWAEKVVRDARV